MKNYVYILLLKSQIRTLKRKRSDMILNIAVHKKTIANRLENIEDVDPSFFKGIDKEIALRKRMIRIIKGRPTSRLTVVSIFF